MAAKESAWGKPGAWALDAKENESELIQQSKEDSSAAHGGEAADYPSLAAAAAGNARKKKPQALSLQEFSAYGAGKPKGLTRDELSNLPTGPRERSAEELDRDKLGGGFRSYGSGGGGARGEQPRRQDRESNREPSRADETDDWGANKKSSASTGFERRERGERGGFFGNDTQSRADGVDNWGSNKNPAPPEPRRYEKRGGFGSESSDGGSDSSNWGRKKEDEGRRSGGAFDSSRERRGGGEPNGAESESWGRKREESSGGNSNSNSNRPRLNLQPRTLPVNEESKTEDTKPRGKNPFGEARPREEVLKEKALDCKEIEEKLESINVKDNASSDSKRSVWSGRETKVEPAHRLPPSGDETGNGGEGSYGDAESEDTTG